jgi:hypothetical protein
VSTYLDYQNRIVDVLAFRGQAPAGDVLLDQSLADEAVDGEVCTGAQMTAQAWLVEFMTEAGSVAHDPDAGCAFMTAARQGRLLTELDVYQAFALAAARLRRRMAATDRADAPADERFADAELTAVAVTPGAAVLTVTVTTQAGTSREVILPLPQPV